MALCKVFKANANKKYIKHCSKRLETWGTCKSFCKTSINLKRLPIELWMAFSNFMCTLKVPLALLAADFWIKHLCSCMLSVLVWLASPQTQDVSWKYMRRSENVVDVFWTSHVRSIYVLCLRGKCYYRSC